MTYFPGLICGGVRWRQPIFTGRQRSGVGAGASWRLEPRNRRPKPLPESVAPLPGDVLFEPLRAFLDSVDAITAVIPAEEQRLFDDLIGIGPGEAVLFSATSPGADFL